MNCYFNQFRIPFTFFDRWYSHQNNPGMEAVPVSPDEAAGMVRNHIGEIKKRGMLYPCGRTQMDMRTFRSRFDPPYIRHEKPPEDPKKQEEYRALESYLDSFIPIIADNPREEKNPDASIRCSWGLLHTHSDLCRILAKALIARTAGDRPGPEALFNDLAAFARLKEEELAEVFNVYLFIDTMRRTLLGSELSYV
jgi:hypothetical protein